MFVHHPLEKKKSVDGASFNRTFLDMDRIICMCISVFLYLIKINLSQNSNVSGFTFFRLQISSFFFARGTLCTDRKLKEKRNQNKTKQKLSIVKHKTVKLNCFPLLHELFLFLFPSTEQFLHFKNQFIEKVT